jgi:glutathione S-transferase/3-isopropylmalate dehydratase
MITVFGEEKGARVLWLVEMVFPYRFRSLNLPVGVEKDSQFLTVNPVSFIPPLAETLSNGNHPPTPY